MEKVIYKYRDIFEMKQKEFLFERFMGFGSNESKIKYGVHSKICLYKSIFLKGRFELAHVHKCVKTNDIKLL